MALFCPHFFNQIDTFRNDEGMMQHLFATLAASWEAFGAAWSRSPEDPNVSTCLSGGNRSRRRALSHRWSRWSPGHWASQRHRGGGLVRHQGDHDHAEGAPHRPRIGHRPPHRNARWRQMWPVIAMVSPADWLEMWKFIESTYTELAAKRRTCLRLCPWFFLDLELNIHFLLVVWDTIDHHSSL